MLLENSPKTNDRKVSETNQPSISFLIPCYKASKTLQRTLDSISPLLKEDDEVIVIDDGSLDDGKTEKIVTNFTEKDKRYSFISEKKRGTYQTRRELIIKATKSYLFFVDADDTVDAYLFSKIRSQLSLQHPDILQFQFRTINENGRGGYLFPVFKEPEGFIAIDSIKMYFYTSYFLNSLQTKLIKRSLFNWASPIPPPENMMTNEDRFIFSRTIKNLQSFYYFPCPCYNYFISPNSLIHKPQISFIKDLLFLHDCEIADLEHESPKYITAYEMDFMQIRLDECISICFQASKNRKEFLLQRSLIKASNLYSCCNAHHTKKNHNFSRNSLRFLFRFCLFRFGRFSQNKNLLLAKIARAFHKKIKQNSTSKS